MKVFVYFNLHRKLWSVKALDGPNKGRVIQHSNYVSLADAEFKVSEAGRQRVLRERKKNVHAGVVGTLREMWFPLDRLTEKATYNPYKFSTFVLKDDNSVPVRKAAGAELVIPDNGPPELWVIGRQESE